jgi:histidine triad (HIT) family protein
MNDCLFCKIVAGEIPSRRIFEDDDFIAFLDIFPASKGHTLVIPKEHHADIHSIPADAYGQLAARAKTVADLLMDKLKSQGTTIFQMNREAGWQTVFHLHMHVIPRWEGDGLHKPWDIAPAVDSELEELQNLLTN